MSLYKIGIDIGGTNIAAAIYDKNYNQVKKHSVPFPKGEDVYSVCKTLKALVYTLTDEFSSVESIGIAVPGSIDSKGTTVIDAHNLGFFDAPLLSAAKEELCFENIALINDADAATIAEHKKGTLQNTSVSALITLGTGVGGGIILNGKLYRGGRGCGVELGHMIIAQDGELCSCSNKGCAEALCSATWIIKQGRSNFTGMIKDIAKEKENVTAKTVIDCAKAGDKVALEIFDEYTDSLSSLTASIINILDVEKIAIGGGVSGAGEFLLAPVIEKTHHKSFFRTHGEIVIASHKNDAGILGAALVQEY